jgi:hypothetical protein
MRFNPHRRGSLGDNWAVGAAAIVLILVAGIYLIVKYTGTNTQKPEGKWYFKCAAAGCAFTKEFDDFDKEQEFMNTLRPPMDPKAPPANPMERMGPQKFTCPTCGKKELYEADYCPNCKEIYISTIRISGAMGDPNANDKCTKCKVYSPGEEAAKQYEAEHPKK